MIAQGLLGINDANINTNFEKNKFFDMIFSDFENIFSTSRTSRYLEACNGDTKKAMTLYRLNLHISQEMFTIISCFEVALRNFIDKRLTDSLGADWLRDSCIGDGVFNNELCRRTCRIINKAYRKRLSLNDYSHEQLLSDMEFGVWKYMFASNEYRCTGRVLLSIFRNRPTSTPEVQYNNTYVFNELHKINAIRNRIAHHEPICFQAHSDMISTSYINNVYNSIKTLFYWLDIDSAKLLYGLDHVLKVCQKIDSLIIHYPPPCPPLDAAFATYLNPFAVRSH